MDFRHCANVPAEIMTRSFPVPMKIADAFHFPGADPLGRNRAQDELHGRAAEAALDKVVDELKLGLLFALGRSGKPEDAGIRL